MNNHDSQITIDLTQYFLHNVTKFKHCTIDVFTWIDGDDSMVGLVSMRLQMRTCGNHPTKHVEIANKVLWQHCTTQKNKWWPLECKETMLTIKPKSFQMFVDYMFSLIAVSQVTTMSQSHIVIVIHSSFCQYMDHEVFIWLFTHK